MLAEISVVIGVEAVFGKTANTTRVYLCQHVFVFVASHPKYSLLIPHAESTIHCTSEAIHKLLCLQRSVW